MPYGWEGKPFEDVAPITRRRDPRRFPVGCATGDGRTQVIQWFLTVPELVQYLLRMEPQRWGVRRAALIELKPRLQAVLTGVDVLGLSERARAELNAITEPRYRIAWWGSYSQLLAAEDAWSRMLVDAAGASALDPAERADRLAAYLSDRARLM